MQEELVNIETARLLNEYGFNWKVLNCFDNTKELKVAKAGNFNHKPNPGGEWLSRPTQTIANKWFREVHKIYITPIPSYADRTANKRHYMEIAIPGKVKQPGFYYEIYEEALEFGLQEAFKYITLKT